MTTSHSATIRTRQRTDGTFAYDVRYRVDGKSRSIAFETERDADAFARTFRQFGLDVAVKTLRTATSNTIPTVDEYAEIYINSKSGVEGKTLDHYRMFMRVSISKAMGSLPLSSVMPETIAAWVNAQTNQVLKAKTIKNRHGFLSAMFQHAVNRDIIAKNPCSSTRMPASEELEMVFLSPDEFTALLDFIPDRHKPLVLLLANTGLRWGEATALKPGDFDLRAKPPRVTVSRAWKSSQDRGYYLGAPKTRRSRRTVSFGYGLIKNLEPLVYSGQEFVFQSATGQPIRQHNFYEGVWNPARRLANGLPAYDGTRKGDSWAGPRKGGVWDREPSSDPIGKMPRVHDLRHSHASWLIQEGRSLPTVQRRLGHESITTTVDRYGHLASDDMEMTARTVDYVLAGAMPQIES
jgi:integrase